MSPSSERSPRLSRRHLLLSGAAAGLSGCLPRAVPKRGEITVWHPWTGVMGPRFKRIKAAFEKAHPHIRVREVYTQNTLAANQKFFTAIAAGTPPDVTFVDGPQVASWAEWGALQPLDERLRSAGVREEEYFPPTWRQNVYQDRVWALTYSADPNFGFAWNKEAFRKAGLDPEKPPQTIEELTEATYTLTRSENDAITQIGMIPWEQYGPANSMFTWGWVFGGEFYEPTTKRITADDPRVVKALEWMTSFARKFDPSRVASLRQGFGTAEQDPFYAGKLAMKCLHIGGIGDIERYAPDLDYGITAIPAPPDGEARCSWVGGWCMSIPTGARNPDDAWELIRWLCHDPEGTATVGREALIFPGKRTSPYYGEVKGRKFYRDYARILEESRHQRPVMPVQAFYMQEMQRAVDAAVYGRKTPAQALAEARRNTQGELDLVLAG